MSNEQPTEESELQPIPEEWQDILLDEIVEADYEVAPSPDEENDRTEQMAQSYGIGITHPPVEFEMVIVLTLHQKTLVEQTRATFSYGRS